MASGQEQTIVDWSAGDLLLKKSRVETIKDACLTSSDPEQAQHWARAIDSELKLITEYQAMYGACRREMSKHITALRTRQPKAKPEPVVELVTGKTYLIKGVPKLWDGKEFKDKTKE